MDVMTAGSADNLFINTSQQTEQLKTLANQALSSGIEKYQDGNYEGAAKDFDRAFRMDMYGDYAYEAIQYASMSYQALGDIDEAIHVYENAAKVNATDDRLFLDMGNLLISEGRYGEALDSLEYAVRLYDDPTNRYSLGQAYLKLERYNEAANQFEKIAEKGGDYARNGYFGLGQTYRAQGDYNEAVAQFQRAYEEDPEFYEAYVEIGYTHVEAGDLEKAEAVQAELAYIDEKSAYMLDNYISRATRPKMLFAYANSTFQYHRNPGTAVSALDDYLSNANASQTFTMKFQFNKEMERESVENILNWNIARSAETGANKYYFGTTVPTTETTLPQLPSFVYYDADSYTATVYFKVNQNSEANGTIDPEHIVFSFSGVDADGNEMEEDFDQYMGFSGSF
jgi:tetratricopeptide (TPR) repeat protein